MQINYDKTADAVYIRIKKGTVKKTARLSNLINADLDKNGRVLGVEILNASIKFNKKYENLQLKLNIQLQHCNKCFVYKNILLILSAQFTFTAFVYC